jgi:hypothetical protein
MLLASAGATTMPQDLTTDVAAAHAAICFIEPHFQISGAVL